MRPLPDSNAGLGQFENSADLRIFCSSQGALRSNQPGRATHIAGYGRLFWGASRYMKLMGIPVGVGIMIGTVVGAVIGGSTAIGVGIAIGIVVGAAIGGLLRAANKPES